MKPKNTQNFRDNFGNNLSKALRKRAMTQVALAEKLGVDKTHVNKWVKNRIAPSVEYMSLIAKELGYDVKELVTGNFRDEMYYNVEKKIESKGDLSHIHLGLVETYIDRIIFAKEIEVRIELKEKLLDILSKIL